MLTLKFNVVRPCPSILAAGDELEVIAPLQDGTQFTESSLTTLHGHLNVVCIPVGVCRFFHKQSVLEF